MLITTIGINHVSAPLELREHLVYSDPSRGAALNALRDFCDEAVILDTCNRSEIYALSRHDSALVPKLTHFLCDFHRLPLETLQTHQYTYANQEAISHLYAVASGIDSLVVGEA